MASIYTPMKVFHYADKLDSLPSENAEIRPPVHIRIKPTNVCSHSCWYCAYRADDLQLGQDMVTRDRIPKEKMLEILADIDDMGVQAVTFSGGGDPFTYPYLREAAEFLSATPIRFASLTNGSCLRGRVAELFAKHATWVRVSIDGWNDESYAKYRGVKVGEFSKVLGNLQEFKSHGGKCLLGVSIIVDQRNAPHLYSLIERLKNLGTDSVKVSPCIVSDDGSENNAYHEPIFQTVKEQTALAAKDFQDDTFAVYDSYHAQLESFQKEYEWCPYQQILPVIGADLGVYPCQDKAYNRSEGLLGSLEDQSFKTFWYENKSRFFRINPSKHCPHHCVADKKNKLVLEYLAADNEHMAFV